MKIWNCNYKDINEGLKFNIKSNTILIQILECCFPKPFNVFKEIYQFEFYDVVKDSFLGESISDEQALKIFNILLKAKENDYDVVVHCAAGMSRSGAVVEFAVNYLGFDDPYFDREPNKLVLKKLEKCMKDRSLSI